MAERTHIIFLQPIQDGQTVSQAPRWEPTTKISITHRNIVYRGVQRRYEKLRELQDRARKHATLELDLCYDAGIMPSTTTTEPTEPPKYTAALAGVPWRTGAQRADTSDTPGEAEDRQDVGTDSGASETDVVSPPFRDCDERDAFRRLLDDKIEMLDQNPRLDDLSLESDTFVSILEEFLDHLEAHCCPCDDAASEQMAASRQTDDLDRHHACVSFRYMNCLQEHIDQLWYFQFDDNMSSMRRTRQSSPEARAAMANSRGVGSPLVDGYTPD
ncbi:hypothetical protein E4U57_006367 [Claviceps arundinis]|uniref:Uncharacterized protein n=1 Tax=Claviceps arundinis TaxID=1623583 RepID=A0ABQ7PGZ1_9HYPO|nr:hypothetical protein E4U57_006367 [Claviceps arundinis]